MDAVTVSAVLNHSTQSCEKTCEISHGSAPKMSISKRDFQKGQLLLLRSGHVHSLTRRLGNDGLRTVQSRKNRLAFYDKLQQIVKESIVR